MLLRMLLSVLPFAFAVGCASGPKAPVYWPAEGPAYTTVGYGGQIAPPKGFEPVDVPENIREVIRRTARDELIRRGYHLALPGAKADVLMFAGVGRRTTVVPSNSPTQAGDTAVIRQATLVLEMTAIDGAKPLWRGSVLASRWQNVTRAPDDAELAAKVREAFDGLPHAGHAPANTEDGIK
jgi:hypothetical protein